MSTRYYLATDPAIIEVIGVNTKAMYAAQMKANTFAQSEGFDEAGFLAWGLFDMSLGGFKCNENYYDNLKGQGEWVNPNKGFTWPRRNKNNESFLKYLELEEAVKIDGKLVNQILGWNDRTFLPSRPGLTITDHGAVVIFHMPDTCDELKGCKEISNIEFRELKNNETSAA